MAAFFVCTYDGRSSILGRPFVFYAGTGKKDVMGMIRVILFDFDMTLVDSSQGITNCMNGVAERMGLPAVSREQVMGIVGIPLSKGMHALWGDYDEHWLNEYRKIFREIEYAGIVPFPKTLPTMDRLRSLGVCLGIATNRKEAEPVVRAVGLFDRFDFVTGLGEIYRPKPEADMVLGAMNALGASADSTLYVGDTDVDIQTAMAAGVRGIGVTTGRFDDKALSAVGAWEVLDGLEELVPIVEREGLS
ncbi:MAG: haloacid dehalogenase [Dethiosulfovibrio peptidovorans]|nr:MAG: haloacid dehalogenase [Dethiosulfovibrio peptidovorans]